ERIIHNPHLKVRPDHAGPHYNILQDMLTQNGMTVEQAVQVLNNSWTQNHDEQVQRWDQQVIDDANAVAENLVQQQQVDEHQPVHKPQEQGDKRADAEKKKAKMKDFCYGNYKLALAFGAGPIDQVTRDLDTTAIIFTKVGLRTARSEQANRLRP
ncbi:hypothetical protein BYT27DRAFT_7121252, partial [Phlegmacium glaucopus]